MFEVSQLVVYGGHGVCCVIGIEERVVDRRPVSYFVLEPVTQPGTRFFIPSHNQIALSKVRYLLEREQLLAILDDPVSEQVWLPDDNRRKQLYRQIIASNDATAIFGMLCVLEQRKQLQMETGRKIHICDENFMRDAYKILCSELCVVLQIPQADVMHFLRQYLLK